MQSYLVFWAYWAGTTDAEVVGELNVHIPGCPQTQRQKNETTLLHCNLLAVGKASSTN